MNFFICTAKIITEPKLLRFDNTALSKIIFLRPSNKKLQSYYSIRVIAKGKIAQKIFDTYKRNDYVIIEGFIYVKKISAQQKKYKVKKYIAMKIQKIHSVVARS